MNKMLITAIGSNLEVLESKVKMLDEVQYKPSMIMLAMLTWKMEIVESMEFFENELGALTLGLMDSDNEIIGQIIINAYED